jgi:hypothetical protein
LGLRVPRRGARFASGVFDSKEAADAWIAKHRLTGLLTQFALNIGAFDYAVEHGFLKLKRPDPTPEFIGGIGNSNNCHFHYEDGVCVA